MSDYCVFCNKKMNILILQNQKTQNRFILLHIGMWGQKKNIVSFFKENRVNNCFPKKHSSFKNITLLFLGYVWIDLCIVYFLT